MRKGRIRQVLRLLGWNALLLLAGVALVATAGEAYLRLSLLLPTPFWRSKQSWEFVSNVGLLRPSNPALQVTNHPDYGNVSRANSLGFLDREPPSPERAAATCHISMIGDSFVEAKQVLIRDKFQVRLEELAADELPHLDITTSAFGISDTGQVQQLPFYDEYARLLRPKLLVLVFASNDFTDNTPVLRALNVGRGRRRYVPEPMVRRRSDGKLELAWSRPGDRFPFYPLLRETSWAARAMKKADDRSRLVRWLRDKKEAMFPSDPKQGRFLRDVEIQSRQPGYAALLEGWRPASPRDMRAVFARRDLPPFFQDALQYTRFALEQFRQRADRDGAKLVILASHTLTLHGTPLFERLREMAATLGIPVIDQADYILRQGAGLTDARWPHDFHWNVDGHRWAAEALLEYLEEHPATCDGPTGAATLREPTP